MIRPLQIISLILLLAGCLGAAEPDSLRDKELNRTLIRVLIAQQIMDYPITTHAISQGAYECNPIVRGRPELFAALNIVSIILLLNQLDQVPAPPEQIKKQNRILMVLVGFYTILLSNNVYQELKRIY